MAELGQLSLTSSNLDKSQYTMGGSYVICHMSYISNVTIICNASLTYTWSL